MKVDKDYLKNKKVLFVELGVLQFLLRNKERVGYSSNNRKWEYNIYKIDDIFICIGKTLLNGNLKLDYSLMKKYEEMAKSVAFNYNIKYEKQLILIESLFNELISKVKYI